MSQGQGPLDGVRVVELSGAEAQFCGKLLADLGADVIKVEPPGGEATRGIGPFLADQPGPDRSLSFWHYNTSKRGVTLDLEHPAGLDAFRRFLPGVGCYLEPGGWLALEIGANQGPEVTSMAKGRSWVDKRHPCSSPSIIGQPTKRRPSKYSTSTLLFEAWLRTSAGRESLGMMKSGSEISIRYDTLVSTS